MSLKYAHIENVFTGVSFSNTEKKLLYSKLHKEHYAKNEIIFRPGDIIQDMFYIQEGCLRTFYVDKKGKEHTVQFGIKDWWISDFTAFFSSSNAIMYLETLQDSIVYRISRDDREMLMEKIPEFHLYIRKKLENAYAAFQKRILSNLSKTARQRYIDFLNTHKDIEKMVKNYHIASYLGITTESLSRIRRDLYN
ncbi:CRP-like cAMP-binding protein [Winogradskyella wandonensis]|uniref:CRP-like cAMP-binding protein n=1 Tax=Winogradskyella wandonensis TaxID=1442586 RepID=A0A4V2PU20_9FLAO|nr:Crp/Fnr family transcriptional regulator [Winogradskyella wandonensis]TCK68721.1 CRP-like cAMP-binding protein [Winogradskyella wandonensis]